MVRCYRPVVSVSLALVCALGCAAPMLNDPLHDESLGAGHVVETPKQGAVAAARVMPTVESSQPVAKPQADVAAVQGPVAPAVATKPTPTVGDAKALGEALARLQAQGAIDEATREQLLDSLKQTDPAFWPQLLQYFETAATLRKTTAPSQPPVVPPLVAASEPAATVDPPKAAVTDKPVEEKPTEKPPAVAKKAPSKASTRRSVAKRKPQTEKKSTKETSPAVEDAVWQAQLASTIGRLEKETTKPPVSGSEIGQHAALRMMYLLAGRREDALKPIEGVPPAQQDFWSKELFGLAAYLDAERNPDVSRRAAEASSHFREATTRLGEIATLQVRNLAFCTEVTSYGVYKTFEKPEFQAGQEVLLYAEVENFKSEHSDHGYHTALKASYQVLDERGARVDEKEFAVTEEHCQNPRRDFFVRYFVWMPQRIYGGTYTLQLSIEDTLSQKIGQASIEFKVKGK